MLIKSSSPRRRGSSLLIFMDSRLRGNDIFELISASLAQIRKIAGFYALPTILRLSIMLMILACC